MNQSISLSEDDSMTREDSSGPVPSEGPATPGDDDLVKFTSDLAGKFVCWMT